MLGEILGGGLPDHAQGLGAKPPALADESVDQVVDAGEHAQLVAIPNAEQHLFWIEGLGDAAQETSATVLRTTADERTVVSTRTDHVRAVGRHDPRERIFGIRVDRALVMHEIRCTESVALDAGKRLRVHVAERDDRGKELGIGFGFSFWHGVCLSWVVRLAIISAVRTTRPQTQRSGGTLRFAGYVVGFLSGHTPADRDVANVGDEMFSKAFFQILRLQILPTTEESTPNL